MLRVKTNQRREASRLYKPAKHRVKTNQRRDASRLYKPAILRVKTNQRREASRLYKSAIPRVETIAFHPVNENNPLSLSRKWWVSLRYATLYPPYKTTKHHF